jgi:translation initiation factor RLI1
MAIEPLPARKPVMNLDTLVESIIEKKEKPHSRIVDNIKSDNIMRMYKGGRLASFFLKRKNKKMAQIKKPIYIPSHLAHTGTLSSLAQKLLSESWWQTEAPIRFENLMNQLNIISIIANYRLQPYFFIVFYFLC